MSSLSFDEAFKEYYKLKNKYDNELTKIKRSINKTPNLSNLDKNIIFT